MNLTMSLYVDDEEIYAMDSTDVPPFDVPLPVGIHHFRAGLKRGSLTLHEESIEVAVQVGQWLVVRCRPTRGLVVSRRHPKFVLEVSESVEKKWRRVGGALRWLRSR
jgi:hypothetical protein